ncbi:hypothetical protein GLOTRDRAFT_129225 [Gloeophyllum trabeum ATCC 11539]|uniref:Uncharacterized protein n=1 Tax=Gloeophyllum trabeum (strain ATCC 11539 / FP-39264 / Madison 617) TaxID=670483 RepID=S7Q948_GLOTA|nr:uncharacterized protein GLOTRDRAFT_129225 [Gloeophyllum trabeum ATCC 11539]EPQ56022.1 hypothetical protein GLOTRDRAFT_129225 [Gloeophyllum trabeum ATCC 11539]
MASWNEMQRANFIALWVMSLLIGAYAVIFGASMYFIISRGRRNMRHMRLVPVTVVLFIIAAAQVVVQFVLVLTTAFAPGEDLGDPETQARNIDRNNLLEAMISFLSVTNNSIADGLLIWRCYNTWGQRWLVIVGPSAILLMGTAAGYGGFGLLLKYYFMTKNISADGISPPPAATTVFHQQDILNASFYTATFIGNAAVTILIVWKIFRTTQSSRNVEAGAGHSCCLLFAALFTIHLTAIEAGRYVIILAAAGISAGAGPTLIMFMLAIGKTIDQQTGGSGSKLTRPSQAVDLPSRSNRSTTLKDSGEIHELSSPSHKGDSSYV